MLKKEILQLYRALNTLGQLQGVKFAYAVSRNLAILKPEIEALEKASSPTPEFMEMDKERIKLVEEHAEKDEQGKPKKKGNEYVIPEDKKEDFENAFEAFKLEHKELFDAREKQIEEYNALLQTESEIFSGTSARFTLCSFTSDSVCSKALYSSICFSLASKSSLCSSLNASNAFSKSSFLSSGITYSLPFFFGLPCSSFSACSSTSLILSLSISINSGVGEDAFSRASISGFRIARFLLTA